MRDWRIIVLAAAVATVPASCAQARQSHWSPAALLDLLHVASEASEQGLPSEADATSEIRALLEEGKREGPRSAQLEAMADELYARLARRFAQGATDPATADPQWLIPRAEVAADDLHWAPSSAEALPSSMLLALLPTAHEYEQLQQEYVRVLGEASGAADADGRLREDRLASLRASLERWRWLPRGLGPLRVEARIPQFEVVLTEPDAPPAFFSAIVGAMRTQTPSFAGHIDGVTLNPPWTPPRSILVNELLPQMRRDAAAREGYDVIGARGEAVDPASVDWSARPFPYVLRQRPGPGSALGQIKFEMPNPYDVYLHDTPNRSLFARDQRALSHGCIRVERPVELAAALLAPSWDGAALEAAIARGVTQSIDLASPVPFYALYITASAWDGQVRYADDIYGRDGAIVSALETPSEASPERMAANAGSPQQQRCPA